MPTTTLPPLPRRNHSVSVEVAAHLERLIASGTVGVGQRLPSERDLAANLGVSRATVREALSELESRRLIVRRHGSGSVVTAPPASAFELRDQLAAADAELRNAAELRDVVEPGIAGLAARRATAADILQLQDLLSQANENLAAEESFRLDREFHLLLARASQNPLLVTLSTISSDWTRDVRLHSHQTRDGRARSIAGHEGILDAVISGDERAAAHAMTRHLHEVRDVIAAAPTSAR